MFQYAIYILILLIVILWAAFGRGYCFSIGPLLLLCPDILYLLTVAAAILFAAVTFDREKPVKKIFYTLIITTFILLIIFFCFGFGSDPVVTKPSVKETEKSIILIEYNEAGISSIGYVCERINPFLLKMDTEYSVDGCKTAHNLGYETAWENDRLILKIMGDPIKEIPTMIGK